MEKRKTKDQKCKTTAKGFGLQRLGSLSNGCLGCSRWKLVGNGCHGNLAAVSSVSLFIKRMTGPQANALKVKPVQSFTTHKFSVCWLNNSWSVGYLHATDQELYWMFFLLQDKLAKHHIRKTTL